MQFATIKLTVFLPKEQFLGQLSPFYEVVIPVREVIHLLKFVVKQWYD